jgi:hypothetical protein
MTVDTKHDELRLTELQKAEIEKGYSYLRWLVIIAAGAFSISFGILIGESKPVVPLIYLAKLALTLNALGVMAGAVAVYGEVKLASGIKASQVEVIIKKLEGKHDGRGPSYILPSWLKWTQRICFMFLVLALLSWVVFVWCV